MIGPWIAWLLVVTACLAGVAAALEPVVRARRWAGRWVWAGTFAATGIVPLLVAVRPRAVVAAVPLPAMPAGSAPFVPPAGPAVPWDLVLGTAWGATSLLMLVALGGGILLLARARRRAAREWVAGAEVAVTEGIGPGAVPFGHPRILVPHWAARLPAPAVRLLVAHEVEHARAGDAHLLLGALLVVATMPWNPVLWWSLRRLRTAIELDCDARVLAQGTDVRAYAQLLLQVAERAVRRPMTPLLALASGATQLEARIDAMTTTRTLTRARGGMLLLAATLLTGVACEARRPAPVAPVTDYAVRDGKTVTLTFDGRAADSVKVALAGAVPDSLDRATAQDRSQPLLLVLDAAGQVVFSGRMGPDAQARLAPARDAIATVDVIKRGDLLPAEAPAGLIKVVLKPGATWPGAAADSAAGVFYKSPAPAGAAPTPAGPSRRPAGAVPHVLLYDGAGALLFEGPMSGKEGDIGPFAIAPSDIARVDVNKAPDGTGTVTVRLKPGVSPAKR